MKFIKTLSLLASLLVLGVLAGCTDQGYDEAQRTNGTAVNGTHSAMQDERYEFVNEMNEKTAAINRKLGKMEGRAEVATGQAKETLEEQIDVFEKQLDNAEAQLDSARNASAENWENVKSQVRTSFNDIEQGIDDSWNRLTDDKN
jgi:DNA anti-recombination protein RmuC